MHPNVTFFLHAELERPGATTMMSERRAAGPFDLERLERAFALVVRRHEAMRCAVVAGHQFDPTDPEAWWNSYRLRVEDEPAVSVLIRDRLGHRRTVPPLALDDPPIARLEVALDDDGSALLRFAMPHGLCDGTAQSNFWHDLGAALVGQALAPVPVGYVEYLGEQERAWRSGAWQRSLNHWKGSLPCAVVEPFPAPPGKLTVWPVWKWARFDLEVDEFEAFERLRRHLGTTPFATAVGLMALAERAAFAWSQAAFITPFANRRDRRTWEMVGLFANLVRFQIPTDTSPATIFQSVRATLQQTMLHGHFPLFLLAAEIPEVMEQLDAGPRVGVRGQPRPGLRSAASTEDGHEVLAPPDDDHLNATAIDYGLGTELLVDFFHGPDSFAGHVTYRSDKLHADTVADFIACYRALILEVAPS